MATYQIEPFCDVYTQFLAEYDPYDTIEYVQKQANKWIQEHPEYQILTVNPSLSTVTFAANSSIYISLTYSITVNYLTEHPEEIDFEKNDENNKEEE